MAYKAEHVVDLDSEILPAAEKESPRRNRR
jgi:hypothetical protein